MALHKDLTGADLHEPKGISSAANGTVYVANGSGSGTWSSRLSGIYNLNEYELTQQIADISTASSRCFFYVPRTSRLRFVNVILNNAITTANATLSVYVNGVLNPESLTITQSGSTAGSFFTLNVTTDNTLLPGTIVEVRSDGASDTTAIGFVTAGFVARAS